MGIHPRDRQSVEGCAAGVMIDGQVTPLPEITVVSDRLGVGVRAVISLDLLDRMSAADRVSGRVCDSEWTLTTEHRAALRELATRMREDASWRERSE